MNKISFFYKNGLRWHPVNRFQQFTNEKVPQLWKKFNEVVLYIISKLKFKFSSRFLHSKQLGKFNLYTFSENKMHTNFFYV